MDTRLICLEAICTGKSTTTELAIESPAREKYIESVKFTNKTPHFWQMAARFEFEEDHSHVFAGPENFDVAPGDTFFYPVQFLSSHQGEYFTSLIVNNLSDGTENVFNITGYALEPKISKILKLGQLHCHESRIFDVSLPHFCQNSKMRWEVATSKLEDVLSGSEYLL